MQKKRPCPKCNNEQRDEDLSKPCNLCGAKQYALIGYRYPQEAKELLMTIRIISGLVLFATLAGAIFFAITQLQLIP
jgi:hypothetical protein